MKLAAAFARVLPAGVSRRLTRYAVPLGLLALLIVVFAGVAVAALVSPGGFGISAARLSQTEDLPDTLTADGLSALDADRDGLSDALENYLYGTDSGNWNSSGLGIPDGWLVDFGFDPLSPLVIDARGATPPEEALPEAYADGWPDAYRPTLAAYYAYGLPDDYRPGEAAPWWRTGPHADPSDWDQSGTGIPTGWLVHHGLPIAGLQADAVLPGSKGNLTVREAFEHDTDPRALDTDEDGLADWDEIRIHGTDPAKFSTAKSGIADGWLLRFRLNPFDPNAAAQDPDRDGLTNLEEFFISYRAFDARIASEGISVLYTRGLDPLDWQTSKSGIPDGWYVRYDLSPFDTNPDAEIGRASEWEHFRTWKPTAEEAPDADERAADLAMTMREAYAYGRPPDWNETERGVWWGGTNPATLDTDGDGMPDPVEILGWYANVTFIPGPKSEARLYLATSNPLEGDSDADGLTDVEEYLGQTDCGVSTDPTRDFPPTNPRNRDTAFSGLTDYEKVCGIVRDDAKYDLLADGAAGLDPTKADTAGDYLHDGDRLEYWHAAFAGYRANPAYAYAESAYNTVFDWTRTYARFNGMNEERTLAEFRPDGDVDADGIANVADADPSGGLYVERFGDPTREPPTKVVFLGGPEIDPELYARTEFDSPLPHSASDAANPDTDGDGLPDEWEIRYGTFDTTFSGWNLDPAKADSNPTDEARNDGEANNDGDEVTWYGYAQGGDGIQRTTHTFTFTNLLEFLSDTDPNRVSTDGDSIADGWKAFWGTRVSEDTFPNLVATRDGRLGDVLLAKVGVLDAAIAESPIAPLTPLRDLGHPAKVTGYVRSLNVTSCASPERPFTELLRPGEQLPSNPCKANVIPLDGRETNFLLIEGQYRLDYRREAELRTNPYLLDSDGDGAPDAYETYMLDLARAASSGATYPHPATPNTDTRAGDDDLLNVADECGAGADGICTRHQFDVEKPDGTRGKVGAGANPNAADSDGDGIEDSIEVNAGLNPLDPSDVLNFRDPNRDGDLDGIADYLELTGWGRNDFGLTVRTDPQDADTDRDGLIDGDNRNLQASSELARSWLSRGIAHRRLSNGSIDFYGEKSNARSIDARPDKLDSSSSGIPDGWRALYPDSNPSDGVVRDAYVAFRPSWWEESRHGVWWWGLSPGAAEAADLDGDGLHDTNGEDPFPAMDAENLYVFGAASIRDPRKVPAFIEAGATADEVRLRAQAIGDEAGEPRAARLAALARTNANGVFVREDHARVAITGVAVTTGAENMTTLPRLVKGVPITVVGRVVLDERAPSGELLQGTPQSRVGVANRTVLVSFFTPDADRVIGAGFTNATGWFNVTANITSSQTFDIPRDGVALLGAVNGSVEATFDPSIVSAGALSAGEQNRLVVWTTNTSATASPGDATYGTYRARLPDSTGLVQERDTHATAFAAAAPLNVTVFSDTRFVPAVPTTVVNGDELTGEVALQDASGGALTNQRIQLTWSGTTPAVNRGNVFTDKAGKVNLTLARIPIAVTAPGEHTLRLVFTSPDVNLASSSLTLPISVRQPTALIARLATNSTTVGDSLLVEGSLVTRELRVAGQDIPSVGVPRQTVRILLGGLEETAVTSESGAFALRIEVPGSIGAGAQSLRLVFDGDDASAPAETNVPISVKRKSVITDLNSLEGPRSTTLTLTGRLLDNEGKGFSGPITVTSPRGRLAETFAVRDGKFSASVPLRNLDLGTQILQVTFAGDLSHGPAQNVTGARVTSTTRVEVLDAPKTVVRGSTFEVRGRLVDDSGEPVEAAAVLAFWKGARVDSGVTDAKGVVRLQVAVNATERPTNAVLALRFDPVPSSFFRASAASANVSVRAGSVLTLDDADARRGAISVTGTLLDDEGRPLPGQIVTVRMGDLSPQPAVTSRNGTFELPRVLPDNLTLGKLNVSASFGGNAVVAPANATADWRVRSPLSLDLSELGPFVRGEKAPIRGRLVDDRGAAVNLPVKLALGNLTLGEITPGAGSFQQTINVPADVPRGPARLTIRIAGNDKYEPYERAYDVIVKIRPKIDVELPALAIRGFAFGGELSLVDDKGEPLRNTSFAYAIGKQGSPVVGRTDAEGRAPLALVAPLTDSAVVAFSVRGGNDVVGASSTYSGVQVVGPATPIGYAGLVLLVLVVLAIAAAIVAAVFLRRRQLQEARDIIDEAIRELLAGNEYAGTIFLAYRRFVAHLSRHGFVEKASETPREFALGVRKALPVGAVPLRELIRLFEEARYSDHPIGSAERDSAVESLAMVRNELDRVLGKNATPAAGQGVAA